MTLYTKAARTMLRGVVTLTGLAAGLDRIPPGTRALLELALVDLHGLDRTFTICLERIAADAAQHRRAA